ncbi:carboxylesterase family protein [Solimonas terrae]|uniref:Carboxylesterase family protein n=1 Tax=Solimonas terrae TaxID=1396819 RepID=A0A6M2BPM8_9GAMM|nr:carboxylesterase family protein [Solimonas terrae]NGY04155.1 carboxylesterase family protein [Solimonas terrae]
MNLLPAIERSTRLGRVRGTVRLGVETYRGLRYAQPARRFQPAESATPWAGTYDATAYRAAAAQAPIREDIFGPMPKSGLSEDCLFLNVHVPNESSPALRPVLVFIHGGSHLTGSGNFYDGTALASGADAVVVCINYRLGIFASIDSTRFGTQDEGRGELWLSDQIAALRWVRENVVDYGGNPELVTIIGESAGAVSVIALCAAPEARGLVHRAVACSPGNMVCDPAPDVVAIIAKMRKCSREAAISYLKAASTGELLALQRRKGKGLGPHEVVNTPLLPTRIEQLIQDRGSSAVPLIAGFATHEGESLDYILKLETGLPWPLLDVVQHIVARTMARHPADGTDKVRTYLKRLKKVKRDIGFGSRFNDLVWTDVFRRASMDYAEATSSAGSRGYVYVIDVPTRIADRLLRSSHCVDLPLTFNVWDDPEHTVPAFAEHPGAPALARRWVAMLGHFARTGEPGDTLGSWPMYESTQRASMRVAADGCRLEYDVDPEYRHEIWT